MGIGRFLAPQDYPGVLDDVFLAEHREEQRILFLVIQGVDPVSQCGKRGLLQRLLHRGGLERSKHQRLLHRLLHLLDNFPQQFFHVDLQRDDVRGQAFFEIIRAFGQEEQAVDDHLHLHFQSVEKVLR